MNKETAEERRLRIKAENEAAERKARLSVLERQEHLARLEFERSAAAREQAAKIMKERTHQAAQQAPQDSKQEPPQEAPQQELHVAAKKGARALYDNGFSLLNGIGVAKDAKAGLALVIRAAELDLPEAAFLAGECFLLGDGCDADPKQAFVWFEKAAKAGELRAQTALGLLCLYELNDRAQARVYLTMAAKRGDSDAIRELKQLTEVTAKQPTLETAPEKKKFWWDRTHELNERRKRESNET